MIGRICQECLSLYTTGGFILMQHEATKINVIYIYFSIREKEALFRVYDALKEI